LQSRAEAAAVVRFTRDAGVYDAQSDGQANRYQLFLERSLALARPGGRIGLVLPAGLAADQGSARLRRLLFARCDVDALVGFDNKQTIFPIHRSVRFLLLTGTVGKPTQSIGCRLGEVDPSILERREDDTGCESWFSVHLSPALLHRLSGNDLSVPDVRAPVDLTIAERAAALFRPLGDDSGWSAHFGRELNATEDRGALHEAGHGLPIIEGKLIEPHRVRLNDARFSIVSRDARRLLGDRHQRWRLAYRDVASATNRLTLIAAILPPGTVSTHTVFCLRTLLPLDLETITASVRKTGRCVIVHEATLTSGFGAELCALVQETCFHHLEAPITRVAGWDTPYPHAQEWDYFPGPKRVAAGIRPNVELAHGAGLNVDRGIVVDDSLRTSRPDIFAIGECAEHRGVCYGLVEPAYEQARVLAAHLAGENAHYPGSVLATNLKVSGVNVFSAGDFIGAPGTEQLFFSDVGLGIYKKLVIAKGCLVGAVLFGVNKDCVPPPHHQLMRPVGSTWNS
jgi:hypothetical protein